eukprot:GILK01006226.1.p1 GENE.GILK01006226.1~~GILK01006226.1.p1  ORF type:complete len:485 (-),score=143.62 GILK01006226.1:1129-2400(-)
MEAKLAEVDGFGRVTRDELSAELTNVQESVSQQHEAVLQQMRELEENSKASTHALSELASQPKQDPATMELIGSLKEELSGEVAKVHEALSSRDAELEQFIKEVHASLGEEIVKSGDAIRVDLVKVHEESVDNSKRHEELSQTLQQVHEESLKRDETLGIKIQEDTHAAVVHADDQVQQLAQKLTEAYQSLEQSSTDNSKALEEALLKLEQEMHRVEAELSQRDVDITTNMTAQAEKLTLHVQDVETRFVSDLGSQKAELEQRDVDLSAHVGDVEAVLVKNQAELQERFVALEKSIIAQTSNKTEVHTQEFRQDPAVLNAISQLHDAVVKNDEEIRNWQDNAAAELLKLQSTAETHTHAIQASEKNDHDLAVALQHVTSEVSNRLNLVGQDLEDMHKRMQTVERRFIEVETRVGVLFNTARVA